MLVVPRQLYRPGDRPAKRRDGTPTPTPTPRPTALTLVAAEYAFDSSLQLTFDRDIDIDAIDPSVCVINDGNYDVRYLGGAGATLIDARTVQVPITPDGAATGVGVQLTAGANSGIVAVDDGGTWPGASELPLPFGG